jgi:hypothetical protein
LNQAAAVLFSDEQELTEFGTKLLAYRLDVLENDVNRCTDIDPDLMMRSQTAPFSALLYCFATIDFLGALYAGDASEMRPTTKQSHRYMTDFMQYTNDQTDLLQQVFRHQIVHLAQPDPSFVRNSDRIAWTTETQHSTDHLKLVKLPKGSSKYLLTSNYTLEYDYMFFVSIKDLESDIRASVYKPNGYFDRLQTDLPLRQNFANAALAIYS